LRQFAFPESALRLLIATARRAREFRLGVELSVALDQVLKDDLVASHSEFVGCDGALDLRWQVIQRLQRERRARHRRDQQHAATN
jgi:hypothetical protein